MKKYTWIDSLKGIAICGVIMVHSGVDVLPFPIGRLACGGAYGVYIFFVLSAFLAYLSFEHVFGRKELSLKAVFQWWCRRFIRLIPTFYLAILLALLIGESQDEIIIGNVITHLLFVFGFFPQYINSILSVEWYLGILVIFYLLMPICYKYINSLQKACCFFGVSFVICEIINNFALSRMPEGYVYESFFGTFWLFEQIPSLSLGIVLYYLMKASKISNMNVYSLILLIGTSGAIVLARPFGILHHSLLVNYTLCSVIAVCLALILNAHRCVVIDNAVWRTIGKYSYPIYLFHCLVLQQYEKYIGLKTGNVYVDWGAKYMIIVVLTLMLAIFVTKYWDTPIQRILRGIVKNAR